MTEEYYTDYPTEPIGGGNPYYRCSYCKRSVPEINGYLERHAEWCEYRINKMKKMTEEQLEQRFQQLEDRINELENEKFRLENEVEDLNSWCSRLEDKITDIGWRT